jgi:hypothetical protein
VTGERRKSARRRPTPDEALSWARLRTGTELAVLDISHHGALVESRTRLLPGTHVDLHLMTTAGRVLQRAKIARAFVGRLDSSTLSYHVALAFDAAVDTSQPRVAATHATWLAGAVATHQREPGQSAVTTAPLPTRSTARQLAPVLETGPGSTSDL